MEAVTESSLIRILLIKGISDKTFDNLGEGYQLHSAKSLEDAYVALDGKEIDVVIMCLSVEDSSGLDNLNALSGKFNKLPIVIRVPDSLEALGKDALRQGASDYLLESECKLPRLVQRVLSHAIDKNAYTFLKRDHERVIDLAREVVKIGSWTWYPQTDELTPSPTSLEIFEISADKEHYLLSEFLNTVHVEDQEKILEAIHGSASGREFVSVEMRIVTPSSEFKYILIKGKPEVDPVTGQLVYYGTSQDITDIKQTTENLIQKNRFLQLTGEIASVGGWEFDLRTKELYWTSASYDIHEKPADFTPSFDNLREMYAPEYLRQMQDSFYRALRENEDIFLEAPIEINNRIKWLQYTGKTVYEGDQSVKVNGIVYDISTSKYQVKKLELRAMMLDNVVEAAIAVDKNGNIIFWNRAAERMFGFTRAETLGKPMVSFDLTDVSNAEMKRISKLLKRGENVSDEYTVKDKWGKKFPIWGSLSSIIGSNGKPEALLCLARDISEEKQHLKRIEDSEFRFRRLFEYSPVGKGLMDIKSFKWIDANNTLIKLLGYSKGELLETTMQDITPPEFFKLDLLHLKRLNRHGVFGPYQKEFVKSDGTRLKVIITGFVMNHNKGDKAWVHVLDITELDETTESLRKSEERFRDYVENSTDIILSIDVRGRIDYISPNIKKTFEYSESEFTGRHFLDFVHPEDRREARLNIISALKSSDENLSVISRIRHRNGKYLYVQSEGKFRVAPNGEKYGIVIARIIDQAHRSELRVRKQNEILKEIAFIQSHVLRRPLANILGLITLSNLNENGPNQSFELFDLIQKEAVIMDEVVEDIVRKSTQISNLSNNE